MRYLLFNAYLLANTDKAISFIAVQVDNTLITTKDQFLVKEAAELQKASFLVKPLKRLTKSLMLRFNGINININ